MALCPSASPTDRAGSAPGPRPSSASPNVSRSPPDEQHRDPQLRQAGARYATGPVGPVGAAGSSSGPDRRRAAALAVGARRTIEQIRPPIDRPPRTGARTGPQRLHSSSTSARTAATSAWVPVRRPSPSRRYGEVATGHAAVCHTPASTAQPGCSASEPGTATGACPPTPRGRNGSATAQPSRIRRASARAIRSAATSSSAPWSGWAARSWSGRPVGRPDAHGGA